MAFVLLGWNLWPVAAAALKPLAVSAGGISIFAVGLSLSAYRIVLRSKVVWLGALAAAVVPVLASLALLRLLAGDGVVARATLVSNAMPPSLLSVMLAQQYRARESEIAAIVVILTFAMPLTLPACMALVRWL